MFAAHPLPGFAVDAAEISYVAAAVGFTVVTIYFYRYTEPGTEPDGINVP